MHVRYYSFVYVKSMYNTVVLRVRDEPRGYACLGKSFKFRAQITKYHM